MGADGATAPPQRVTRYVYVVASAGAVAWGASIVLAWEANAAALVEGAGVLALLALLASLALTQFYGFEIGWRRHHITVNFEEAVICATLALVPGPAAAALLPLTGVVTHAARGRARIKGLFNVTHDAIAALATWAAFVALSTWGAPTLVAAVLALPVYPIVSNALLAGVFARFEGEPAARVYRERLLVPVAASAVIGTAGGTAIVALLSLHPLALLALAPFAYLLRRTATLTSRADKELSVHRRLDAVARDLVGTPDVDAVAARVLEAAEAVLPAGRVALRLDVAGDGEPPREWTLECEGGASSIGRPLSAHVPGRDGRPVGELVVWPRSAAMPLGDAEIAIARVVAGQAGIAIANARALEDLEIARETALTQQNALAKQEKLSALGMLVANVAHEIGNPVAYLRASLELSRDEVDRLSVSPHAETREAAGRIKTDLESALKGADRLVDVTQALKAVARHGPEGVRVADVNALARDVAKVVRVGFPRSVDLALELHDGPAHVRGDPGQLTQVLLNLVKNAAEALGPDGGRVRVRTRIAGARVLVDVTDDGPGLTEDARRRLFEPFFTTKSSGTGLGLNISQRIARRHGGELRVESAPGEGATFTLDLPISEEADAPVTPP